MKIFNQRRDNRGGFKSEDRSFRRTMYQATCAECGKSCEVPFRPSGDKPVYCSDCFESKRGSGERIQRKNFGRQSFNKDRDYRNSNQETKRQLETIINKLDQLIYAINQKESPVPKKQIAVKKTKKIKKSA
jgi:CxxC-x17-CxxC domain-containing protein